MPPQPPSSTTGRIVSINVSDGGVPKLPVPTARITKSGVSGDRQNDLRHHGGPERAVSLYSLEIIDRLRAEAHPISPGAAGENITISGLDWSAVAPGARLHLSGGPVLEVASYCKPCRTIRDAFTDADISRINQSLHPGESRVYARVIQEGPAAAGDTVTLAAPFESPRA